MDPKEFAKRFDYHPPSGEAKAAHGEVRDAIKRFGAYVADDYPDQTRELALFWTAFEEASFWLHAHIARNVSHEE